MKKIISILAVTLMVLVLVGCGLGDDSSSEDVKYDNYKLGEVGKSGKYQLKTVSYLETENIVVANESYTTQNKYVIVNIEIASNDEGLSLGYNPNDFRIVDKDKKTYNCESIITNNLNLENENKDNSYVGIFKDLEPGVLKKTQLVFDIPKEIKPILIINKNYGSADFIEFMLN